jgi:hypothetical protein
MEVTTLPILSAEKTAPKTDTDQSPKISGRFFDRGPNHHSKNCVPIRLIASVAIKPRIATFGLSWMGMNPNAQMMTPPSAPERIPAASTAGPHGETCWASSQAP